MDNENGITVVKKVGDSVYSFESLSVWNKSRALVKLVYKVTAEFPADERFGLISQMRRASVSVSSNIAEGSTRWGNRDQARFYEISFGSLIEILNQSILANDLEFIEKTELQKIRNMVDEIARMLNALHTSAKKKSV
ncbi:MAG: four helix bundle protein [Crocinitomicaceae bacterium]|nr:four helix bundle protein [Crocinitomicaceae bacterium]